VIAPELRCLPSEGSLVMHLLTGMNIIPSAFWYEFGILLLLSKRPLSSG
jgi:hypothetical protein